MISIVFASNNFNHHEKFLCEELYHNPKVDFRFIQTQEMNQERTNLGWGENLKEYPYVMCSYGTDESLGKAMDICRSADVMILGSAPYCFVADRVRNNKLTFYYAERLFRNGLWHLINPKTLYTVIKRFILPGRKSNFYLLAASGYTAIDTANIRAFEGRRFKWGHFIDTTKSNHSRPDNKKLKLLWAGRFLTWKHPDYPIRAARTLKENGIEFHLDIIGTGVLETALHKLINQYNISDVVTIHGRKQPSEVRHFMENADIYMFTSDFNEGWGAVLGEAMASGCAVVASHAAGATPFLAEHKTNALIYENDNYGSFERNFMRLVESEELRKRLSQNAVTTMSELWTPRTAADRFYNLCKALLEHKPIPQYTAGPISVAEKLKNNWFKDDTIKG